MKSLGSLLKNMYLKKELMLKNYNSLQKVEFIFYNKYMCLHTFIYTSDIKCIEYYVIQ